MIKIGDFSKLSHVSIKTLRYYDELGLLKPVQVDPFSGYRFYSAEQLLIIHRILVLKDLGIPLEQIQHLLRDGLPPDQMIGILRQRKAELKAELETGQQKLERLEVRLRQFEQESNMSAVDVVIKSIPEITVASIRGKVKDYPDQGVMWDKLEKAIAEAGIHPNGPCFTIDHDKEYRETEHDLEVCEPLAVNTSLMGLTVRTLPAVAEMASMIYHGAFNNLPSAYQQMMQWMEENGYQICGSGREIYVYTGTGECSSQDDPSYITEIQFPVVKAGL